METTPSSTRRITRSQTKTATFSNITNLSSKKIEEPEKDVAKNSNQRSCLADITNDSPIVGVASGTSSKTPISSFSNQKKSSRCMKTPGSGEALLRGQVKNLLQKVEEEAEISKFLSFETDCGRHGLKAFLNSPAGLLAPTPANTPAVFNFNSVLDGFQSLGSVLESPIEDQLTLSKVMSESEPAKDIISRSLFLDFADKSDCSSVLACLETGEAMGKGKSPMKVDDEEADDDDASSVWSIQVNASTRDDDEDVVVDEGESKSDVPQLDELCEGMMNISMNEEETAAFMGKHIRFVYNSDDELIEEEEEEEVDDVLRLKGLPTPKGKHLRFQDE